MAKTKISQYDATAANNTDIDSINIAEGMAPSNVNNAIRELMAHLKDMDAGTQALTSPQLTSADINGGTIDGVTIGGASAGAGTFTNLTATGTTTLAGASTSADITFGDNDKAIFGAGSDLQIYHDGFNSYISDQGTGNLKLLAENFVLKTPDDVTNAIFADTDAAVYLYNAGNQRLATTSTGIDVTGTVTADGLTVSSSGTANSLTLTKTDGNATKLVAGNTEGTHTFEFNNGGMFLSDTTGLRLGLTSGGDISFYEDTGTTAKFFWDASAESLGIGTSSPSTLLHLDAASDGRVARFGSGTSDTGGMYVTHNSGSTRSFELSADNILILDADRANGRASSRLQFNVDGTERMRIDSSGNLLVGTTSFTGTSGVSLSSTGYVYASSTNDVAIYANRENSDGDIAVFRKDGTTVGSISSRGGEFIAVGSGDTFLEFNFGSDQINPSSGTAARDNAIDLGSSGARFDDIYATNGTIQTSDRNEKQDIAELSEAEQRVAVAAKGLLRKFRWKDAVAEKGDEARTHFGIIAQDLQAAFAGEGLDAGDYAMFISSTWTDEETGEERTRMGVRYSELLAFIIAAI